MLIYFFFAKFFNFFIFFQKNAIIYKLFIFSKLKYAIWSFLPVPTYMYRFFLQNSSIF